MNYEDPRVALARARHAEIGIPGLDITDTRRYEEAKPGMQAKIREASEIHGFRCIRLVHLFGCNAGSPVWAGLQDKGCRHTPIPGFFDKE